MSYSMMELRIGIVRIFAEAQATHWIGREKGLGKLSKLRQWSRGAGLKACTSEIARHEAKQEREAAEKAARKKRQAQERRAAALHAKEAAKSAKKLARSLARAERLALRAQKTGLRCPRCNARSPTHVCR